MRAGIRAGTLQKPTEPTSPAQSIALLCIPDSSTLTCAGAGLSQRFSLLFRGSRRKIPQGWPQPTAIFRAQKVKKKKNSQNKRQQRLPAPSLQMSAGCCLIRPGSRAAVSPRGGTALSPPQRPAQRGGQRGRGRLIPAPPRAGTKRRGREFSATNSISMLMSAPGSILPPVANWSENPGLRGCNFYVR